jgi:putative transposase
MYMPGKDISHEIQYHVVWSTRYRIQFLTGNVAYRAREIIRQLCESQGATIMGGSIAADHIDLLIVAPPELAPLQLVEHPKEESSARLQTEIPSLCQQYWHQHLWSVGFEAAIKEYLEDEELEQEADRLTIISP